MPECSRVELRVAGRAAAATFEHLGMGGAVREQPAGVLLF